MVQTNSAFLTDSYKLAHHEQYPDGTSLVFSNFTPRTNKYASEATKSLENILVFGVQLTLMKIRDHFNQNFFFTSERGDENFSWNAGNLVELKKKAIDPIKEEIELFLGMQYDTTHFEKLWDLGYLPLEIRALDEGTLCPIKVPMLTIHNTHPDFFWLPNFLETILSQMLWKPMTSATIALSYRKTMEKWAEKTNPEGKEFVLWQGHDFSMRGLDAVEATQASGLGHLSVFYGTDSLPTLSAARYYYGAKGFIAGSVPATEHSVMSAGGNGKTFEKKLIKGVQLIEAISRFKDEFPNLYTLALDIITKNIEVNDGEITSKETDESDRVYGYFSVENNEIVNVGEERVREGGYFWVKGMEKDSEIQVEVSDELSTFRRLMKNQPKGILSVVSDTWDLWKVLTVYLPELKEEIMTRDGKLVIRPDSGDPVDIICGTDQNPRLTLVSNLIDRIPSQKGVIELLWDVFGGTVNEQGYKVLDPHIGAIYGDSITNERCEEICKRLEAKGFASTNIVFGIGSYTYQFNTRDTFGFACKATYVEKTIEFDNTPESHGEPDVEFYIPGLKTEGFEIFKDPVTDTGMKKSARGLLRVLKRGDTVILHDQCTWDEVNSPDNQLKLVFIDGKLLNPVTLEEVRNRVNKLM